MPIGSLTDKLGWLFTHPEFRRYPLSVLAGVIKWEYIRLRGAPTTLDLGPFRLQVRPHDGVGRLVCYFGEAADDMFAFLERYVQPGMTVIDVGANVGSHCLYAGRGAGPAGQVVAFEPDPNTAELLLRNLAANQMSNVEVHETCLNDEPGPVQLHVNRDSAKTSMVRQGDTQIDRLAERLDAVIAPGTAIDLLKIDVEGADYSVLEGARGIFEARPPAIVVIEVSEHASEIWDFLTSFGFRLFAYQRDADALEELAEPVFNCYAIHGSMPLSELGNGRYRLVSGLKVSQAV
jgi:FkbM family methyltransferase